ncbi:YkyA family protein [Paenibacillus sp. N1-5-1-14]|uniref:YkyA family protein n=1 Tax=Paenibacillus radicibacter TaxID=2972488 RepID=UPI002159A0E7|nr:YkyA family protein [Paenibacillus radicibacter]MCR8642079.1 YkyA family protein [Paenibacillus radicibacter]
MNKSTILALGMTVAVLLTGCDNQQQAQSNLMKKVEEVLQTEVSRTTWSDQISDLEQADQHDFLKIVEEGKKSNHDVKNLIQKCLQNIDQRKSLLTEEKQVLTQAADTVKNMNSSIKKLRKTEIKNQASSVLSLYERRYAVYQNMRTSYEQALAQEQGLYDMLAESSRKLVDIDNLVYERNNSFNKVTELMVEFNELTDQFNKEYQALEKLISGNKV